MLLGFRPERAFSLAEIPQLALQERFKRADRFARDLGCLNGGTN